MAVNSGDLVLMLDESPVNPDLFTSYNTQSLILNGFKIEASIVGESHLVVCEIEEKKSFTEVLACVPSDKVRNNSMRKFPLSGYSKFNIWDLVFFEHYKYSFFMEKIGFDDQNYKSAFLNFLRLKNVRNEVWKSISYNFSTKSVEFKNEMHDPITLISVGELFRSWVWNSIHVYPEEKLGVFSQSILRSSK